MPSYKQHSAVITGPLLIALILPLASHADEQDGFKLRPHAGYGYASSEDTNYDSSIHHYGARALLRADETHWYGLEVSQFKTDENLTFTSIGIVLEQTLYQWFSMSIGTIGYFGIGDNDTNPIGLTTSLGWEPTSFKSCQPFVTLRRDAVFADEQIFIHSLSLGVSW